MTIGTEGSNTGCPRWAKLLLIASLAVNAAVIGLYIAQPMKDRKGSGKNRQIEWILKLVPEDRRDFTKEHFAGIRGDLRALQDKRLEHFDQIISVIATEPFVAGDLNAVLQDRRDASTKRRKLVHDKLVELLAAFTPEERALFAERLQERIDKWREKRRRD